MRITWPNHKRFAFTIFDDTDYTTLENAPQVYQLLADLGMLTTKSVWPLRGGENPAIGGATCDDPEYLAWVKQLQSLGFEIAMHNATYHTSDREGAVRGLETFKSHFGDYPGIHVNHAGCEDSIYWGDARLTGINRLAYNLLTRFKRRGYFGGSDSDSNLFWADRCQSDIKYVRNFVYSDINTLKVCPQMPYKDPDRPFVNHWFASSEGPVCESFCRTISEANQDRLEAEGGACIMYTHFGVPDFYEGGGLNPEFVRLMERLSRKDAWFVPVSTLLDYIIQQRGEHVITARERFALEFRWLVEKVFLSRGTS